MLASPRAHHFDTSRRPHLHGFFRKSAHKIITRTILTTTHLAPPLPSPLSRCHSPWVCDPRGRSLRASPGLAPGFKLMAPLLLLLVLSFALCMAITPLARWLARYGGLVDQPDGRRKMHGRPIPVAGGLAVPISVSLAVAVVPAPWHAALEAKSREPRRPVPPAASSSARRAWRMISASLRVRHKFLGQCPGRRRGHRLWRRGPEHPRFRLAHRVGTAGRALHGFPAPGGHQLA